MGLWPVCFDNSGPAEYIRRFGFGDLARDQDHQDLIVQLSMALRELPWMNSRRREELRAATIARFSPEAIWTDLIRLYGEIA